RTSAAQVPRPVATVAVSPSVAAARAAVAEASRATGTESPAEAGASYARPSAPALAAAPAPAPAAAAAAPAPRATTPRPAASAPASSGPWRVQLGAFAVAGNADQLWSNARSRAELAGKERLMVRAGRVPKLRAGGFPTRAAADAACRSLKRSGHDCLVTHG